MNIDRTNYILDKLSGLALYILIAAVAFSTALTEIATVAIIAAWFLKKILSRDYNVPCRSLSIILLAFILWNLASFINTSYLNESMRGLLKVIKHSLLFIAVVEHFDSGKKINRFLIFGLGCGFIIAVNGIVQNNIGYDLIRGRMIDRLDYLHRISSSFVHSNDFGAYLIVFTTMLLSLFFTKKQPFKKRVLILFVSLPFIWCLRATGSRGAWLGFAIAFIFMAMLKSKRLVVAILIALIISPFFVPVSIKSRFSDLKTYSTHGTTWERLRLWQGTAAMVKAHPFLGFGVNTYTKNFPEFRPKDYPDAIYTHNSYLHMAAEIGIVGAGIFLLFLGVILLSSAKAFKRLKKGPTRDFAIGTLAGTAGFLAHSGVDTHFYSVTLSAFMFLCLGLIIAFRNLAYEANS